MKPEGESECATGIKIFNEDGRQAALSLQYGLRHKERMHAKLSPLLGALAPRMKRALQCNRILLRRGGESFSDDLLQSLLAPAFIVNENRSVLATNRATQAMSIAGDVIRVGAADRLSFRDRKPDLALGRLVAEICRGATGSIGQLDFTGANSRSRYRISVLPVAQNIRSLMGRGALSLFATTTAALIVVQETETESLSPAADLRARFGLTEAEARIAEGLRTGNSLVRAAEELGIAYETARNQLKAVFAKTDTHRQSELVALLSRLCR